MKDDVRPGLSFGPFQLFPSERRLERDGRPVTLGSRAFDVLAALAERPGEVVGKRELMARAWPGLTVDESNLRVHVAALRKALGDGEGGVRYIANVPVRGYSFVAPVATIGVGPGQAARRPADTRRPLALPPLPARLLGRDQVVRRIVELLGRKRLVTVHGPGGIGKTTVALAVAHEQFGFFGGAVRFLDLAPLADPALVCSALGSALGLLPRGSDPSPEVIAHLREQRMFIVLDSCEHLVGGVADLAERILREAPQVSLLVTSRERLRVEGEHVVELPPLDRPPDGAGTTVAQVMSFAATQLFAECAAAAGHGEPLTDADAQVVAVICRKLDGMALAIELVAARVPSHGLAETAALLDSRLRLLWRGRRTALPRHQTLQAVLDWSHELIDTNERCALRRLAIFVGPFSLTGAQAVAADGRMGPEQVVEALDALVAKSLVSLQRGSEFARYRLLDTTRAYAREKLVDSGELESVSRRHACFVRDLLQDAGAWAGVGDRAARQAAERALLGDVQSALGWSFSPQGDARLAAGLAAAATGLFTSLSLLRECRRWVEAALACRVDDLLGTLTELTLQAALGHALTFTEGNDEPARAALERALHIAVQLDDPENQFRLLGRLHMVHRRTGELDRLLPIAERLDALAARTGSPAAIAAAHTLRGLSHHLVGDQRAARVHLEAALHLGEFDRVAPSHFAFHRNPYIALSRAMWLLGFPEQALSAAQPLATEAASPDGVTHCISLIWGAAVFKWVGDWTTVGALAEKLVHFARHHALRNYETVGLGLRGEVLVQAGSVATGAELLRSAIGALRADRYDLYVPGFVVSLATALASEGRTAEARSAIDDTLARLQPQGDALEMPELLRVRAETLALEGDDAGAEAGLRAAVREADRQHALSFRLRAVTSLARLVARRGDGQAAREHLQDTLARFSEGFQTQDLRAAAELVERLSPRAG